MKMNEVAARVRLISFDVDGVLDKVWWEVGERPQRGAAVALVFAAGCGDKPEQKAEEAAQTEAPAETAAASEAGAALERFDYDPVTIGDDCWLGADVFVFPSLFEGFGIPILEAFAAEVPVLTSDVSSMPEVAGKVTYRLKRPTLIGFAYAMGMDPFAAYGDEAAYQEILDAVEAKLIECKANVKTYWSGGDELLNLMRSGETVASMAWD